MDTAIQLYTLRDVDETPSDLLSRVAETTFDGVEFAGAPDAAAVDALDETGLDAAAAHVGIEELEDRRGRVLDACEDADCDTVVVPVLDESNFESRAAVEAAADRLTAVGDAVADRGFRLAYHNHDHEFTDLGGTTGFELLVESVGDTVSVELDTGWALAAGEDPAALLRRLGDVPLVHLKDVDADAARPVELGEGDLDAAACADAAREVGAEWIIYEHDEPSNPLTSLPHGAAALDALR
ncbi:sugar phosphate isomerase/epimerase [Halostella sp. JP-L12]|uniref:sugar phosphate isomerase/epimerase family protein n=1 Tax=Halostella TaxID=1843185 RepID=UPI000EF83AC7|nr:MULTISPECIES: sugar phosphate isomerase/epimerase [Halostella]NHN47098.1 sugar phosphate isomerase/epimerase [Halostella sp. JP-L12]